MKFLNLEPQDIVHLRDSSEHFSDGAETHCEQERLQIIADWLSPLINNDNLIWTLHVEERMPQCADNIINELTARMKELEQVGSEVYVFYEHLFWERMEKYDFILEEHTDVVDDLSPEDAQRYAILHIAEHNEHFYSEEKIREY